MKNLRNSILQLPECVTFSGGSALNRATELRPNQKELDELCSRQDAKAILFWRGKPLIQRESGDSIGWVRTNHKRLSETSERPVFLGFARDAPVFAYDISDWILGDAPQVAPDSIFDETEQFLPGFPDGCRFANLRSVMTSLSADDAEIVVTGKVLTGWHHTHRFCPRCGSATEMQMGGWQRACPACSHNSFCRTDPVVIMLVTKGNSLLVGRSHGWPAGMYSLLAGFVEPGETIEAAVRREVLEEAGVNVGKVGYLASQPWPFPASLMIGCRAEAETSDISVDAEELEDARWIAREDMLEVYAGRVDSIRPPRNGAIADYLTRRWLADCL